MIDMADILRQHIEQRIRKGEIQCGNSDCESRAFDVRVWKNIEGVPHGAAICRKCGTRTEITMSKAELQQIQEPFDELEEALNDVQDSLDEL